MTDDENGLLKHIAQQNETIIGQQADFHARLSVVESHMEESKTVMADYRATKNKGIGLLTGVAFAGTGLGAAVSTVLAKLGIHN